MNTEKLREGFIKEFLSTMDIRYSKGKTNEYPNKIFDFFLPHLKSEAVEVSDKEINIEVMNMYPFTRTGVADDIVEFCRKSFTEGAKWMRDKQGIAPCKEVEFAEWIDNAKHLDCYGNWINDYDCSNEELYKIFIKETT